MSHNQFPEYEGEMQLSLEAALEHLNSTWGALRRAGLDDVKPKGWPPDPKDYTSTPDDLRYPLAAATRYVWQVWNGMQRAWGSTEGQLCPSKACAYNLAIPKAGWYVCGHCLTEFYARDSEGEIEDYHTYLDDYAGLPSKPKHIPMARVLGKSWATPDEG